MITILGAGLAGLSCSYHLGHDNCIIFEKNSHPFGHIYSENIDGFIWDEGPHVSFTEHEYVRDLFAENVDQQFLEYPVQVTNYYEGSWIPHPAQTNLFAISEPLRSACVSDFLLARNSYPDNFVPANYQDWIEFAFGKTFAAKFPYSYTKKYWTIEPKFLTTEWVGQRVHFPNVDQLLASIHGPLPVQTHYVKKIRYPLNGGYMSFARKLVNGANINFNIELERIVFKERLIYFNDGSSHTYEKLINSIPLPILIENSDAPLEVKQAAKALSCSSVLLINVAVNHLTVRPENWIYVYDEDKYSTRINCVELLSPNNAPTGKSGIQVEVYFSKYKPQTENTELIAKKVCEELVEMGLITDKKQIEYVNKKFVAWANIIFDQNQKSSLDIILSWLEQFGLSREDDDLRPMTDWKQKENIKLGDINLAGRFGQWKYYWTDDCVLRGKKFIQ